MLVCLLFAASGWQMPEEAPQMPQLLRVHFT